MSEEDFRNDSEAGGTGEKAATGEDHHDDPRKVGNQASAGDRRNGSVEPEPSPAPIEEDVLMAMPKDTRPKETEVAPGHIPTPQLIDRTTGLAAAETTYARRNYRSQVSVLQSGKRGKGVAIEKAPES